MEDMEKDGIVYRLVTLRNRSKWVSKNGDLINPYRKQNVSLHYNNDGYPCCGGGIPVHQYVAYGWVEGYYDGAEVNHKDFDRNNYDSDNLEWVTHKQNVKYSVHNNSEVWNNSKRGTNNGRSHFSEEKIKEIRHLYDNGMSVADIMRIDYPNMVHASDYKSIHSTYLNICKRKTWKHIV